MKDSRRVMEHLLGPTEASMKGNSKTTISKDSVITFGLMVESMKAHGETIKCTAEAFSFGLMVENIKGSISMIKNKDMENLAGLMEDHIRDSGKMANRTEKALTATRKALRKMVSG